jgi:hypothetical protein
MALFDKSAPFAKSKCKSAKVGRKLTGFDLNFLFSLLRFRTFRQHDRQHALLEARGGLICVSILWHLKRTLEGATAGSRK